MEVNDESHLRPLYPRSETSLWTGRKVVWAPRADLDSGIENNFRHCWRPNQDSLKVHVWCQSQCLLSTIGSCLHFNLLSFKTKRKKNKMRFMISRWCLFLNLVFIFPFLYFLPVLAILLMFLSSWPPLWSSGQSSWLQIQRSGLDSRRYQIFWEVVGLERGPLSLLSTIEELLERKGARSSVVVKALCYKPEGRGSDTQWGDFLNLPNPSGRTGPWGILSL
jgi:hypothetical protein